MIYAGLGEDDQAMAWLEKAYSDRFNPSILLRPGFDALRSDSRFQDLVRRIGLENSKSTAAVQADTLISNLLRLRLSDFLNR
jgi:hypothetical protein